MNARSLIGTLIYYCMNIGLIMFFFARSVEMRIALLVVYVIMTAISLSPVGEWFICLFAGAKEIPRNDMKLKIIPLVEFVLKDAISYMPPMPRNIRIRYIDDPSPMAYALGRRTICITDGLLKLPDDEIMGALSHEIGHLALRHTTWQLLIGGSNAFIAVFMGLLKLLLRILLYLTGVSILPRRTRILGIIMTAISFVINSLVRLWLRISMMFLCWTKRENEYQADEFAYNIGYGLPLAKVLDRLKAPKRSTLIQTLLSSTPDPNERIGRLQTLGLAYNAYS